jgi:ATP-dependent Lon protease
MAGEVTLHGKILKVDKIKDRFVAAKALGYSKIILPRENFAEIEALPESVKSDIECHLVDDYDQVFNIVFTAANANTLHIHGNENENSAQRPHEVGG